MAGILQAFWRKSVFISQPVGKESMRMAEIQYVITLSTAGRKKVVLVTTALLTPLRAETNMCAV